MTTDGAGPTLPEAPESEATVVGGILLDPDAIGRVAATLDPAMFRREANGVIYSAALTLYQQGEQVDPPAVYEELRRSGEHEKAGGMPYISDLLAGAVTTANIEWHAKQVRDRATRRALYHAAQRIQTDATDPDWDLTDLLDRAERQVFGVSNGAGSTTGAGHIKSRLIPVLELVESGGYQGVPTGYLDLDRMLVGGGLLPGQLVVVAGATAMGKTAFCHTMALHLAIHEQAPVGYVSIEMTNDDNTLRLLCAEALVDMTALLGGRIPDGDHARLAQAAGHLNTAPLWLDDQATTVAQVRSQARRLVGQHGIKALFVDHIQDMEDRAESRREQLGSIIRGLKQLAKELGITVVAVSQLSRSVEGRNEPRPRLSDLKESGDIENAADVVLLLYRPEYYHGPEHDGEDIRGKAECIVAKQRNGPTGPVPLYFRDYCTRYENAEVGA